MSTLICADVFRGALSRLIGDTISTLPLPKKASRNPIGVGEKFLASMRRTYGTGSRLGGRPEVATWLASLEAGSRAA
jgi:hypothetical protein